MTDCNRCGVEIVRGRHCGPCASKMKREKLHGSDTLDKPQMIDAECGDCGTETEFAGEPTDRFGDSLRLHCPECGKPRSHNVTAARVVR